MAYRLVGEPMPAYCQWHTWEQSSVKFESKYKTFHYENAFENVVWEIVGHFVEAETS